MTERHIRQILHLYGLSLARASTPQKGYRNQSHPLVLTTGETCNLILFKSEPGIIKRIQNADAVAEHAAASGLPTRVRHGKIVIITMNQSKRHAALYNYLAGDTIAWEAYTMKHIKSLGSTMSQLHSALHTYSGALPNVADEYSAIYRRMQHYFSRDDVRSALTAKLNLRVDPTQKIATVLQLCSHLPNQQALHMDFVRGNILFEQTNVTGIIDFEKASRGHPIFDIARTLAFLLVDCTSKSEQKIRKYFLISGYNKRGGGAFRNLHVTHKDTTHDVLETLLDMFLLYDLYKFLRHNPYESLLQNHHFVRTRDILIARGLARKDDVL